MVDSICVFFFLQNNPALAFILYFGFLIQPFPCLSLLTQSAFLKLLSFFNDCVWILNSFIFVANAMGTQGCAQIEDSGQGGLRFSENLSRERDLASAQDSGHGQLLLEGLG